MSEAHQEAQEGLPGWVRIGAAPDLLDGGTALCFKLDQNNDHTRNSGFVIRHQGAIHGYVNRCAHQSLELDWQPGQFFDLSRVYLICAVHGALFKPESGLCVEGPCRGRSLQKLRVVEHQGSIYWQPDSSSDATSHSTSNNPFRPT